MCGIFAIFGSSLTEGELRRKCLQCAKSIRHRGPDWSGICQPSPGVILAHERLAIIDPVGGSQPLVSDDGSVILLVNGEIYNYKELKQELSVKYNFATGSDCEVIIPLYMQHGLEFVNMLRGMFSFVLYDVKKGHFLVVRDHMGITPLYMGHGEDGSICFASEMKALLPVCDRVEVFLPRHLYWSETETLHQWYKPLWLKPGYMGEEELCLKKLKQSFEEAVIRRMQSDVPWGVLLSGGLDSSLVGALAARHAAKHSQFHQIHSFCIGVEGSPDLVAAQEVADHIQSIHHPVIITAEQGLDAVRDVIYHLETYDVTTIRAATPMYLLARQIKALGFKMVLSGEGSDEAFGGYLYFHKAPNPEEFFKETVDKLQALHMYDCLRANKATSAWGVEVRVPFLDRDFLDVVMNLSPKEKMIDAPSGKMEKWVLRKAFDEEENPLLPSRILWRQKEQFSDGVGYSWIDSLKDWTNSAVSDQQLNGAARRYPYGTPQTKEAYMYRSIFEELFPVAGATQTVPGGASVACSTPRALEWDASFAKMIDPSGRAVRDVHAQGY